MRLISAQHDLTTTDGTLSYLCHMGIDTTSVQILGGGHSAYTYRATLKTPLITGQMTVILKHFERYGYFFKESKTPVQRGEFEYKALVALAGSSLFTSSSIVQVPRPIRYDSETHTIFMEDLGPLMPVWEMLARCMKNARADTSHPRKAAKEALELASEVGSAIGDFLGRFHNWSESPDQAALLDDFSQNDSVEGYMSYSHQCMMQSAEFVDAELDDAKISEILAGVRKEDLRNGSVLTMGDCTLNNVMIPPTFDRNALRLYILDWETVGVGRPEFDMGVLTGTTLSFAHRYGSDEGYPFLPALHQAYQRHRELSPVLVARATGMYGMALAAMKLRTEGRVEKYLPGVRDGFELLKLAHDGNNGGIRKHSILKNLFISAEHTEDRDYDFVNGC